MQYSSGLPAWFMAPFANAGDKNTIPATTTVTGAAALNTGWPSICSLPEEAGGIAPTREDLNGILYWLSNSIQRLQAGGFMPYDATFAAAIGGYPKGAFVRKADGTGYWMSTADGNTTDPDGGSAANWSDARIAAGDAVLLTGNQTVAGIKTFSSSPVIPNATAAQQAAAYGQVVLLTGNQTVAGIKTFTSSPVVPNATEDDEPVALGQFTAVTSNTFHRLTSVRDFGTTYTNTTEKEQKHTVCYKDNGVGGAPVLSITPSGSSAFTMPLGLDLNNDNWNQVTFFVEPGDSYSISTTGATKVAWWAWY